MRKRHFRWGRTLVMLFTATCLLAADVTPVLAVTQADIDALKQETAKLESEKAALEKEKRMQQAMLSIKKKYGKNAILKGMNLEEGATTKDRNNQIGGHRA